MFVPKSIWTFGSISFISNEEKGYYVVSITGLRPVFDSGKSVSNLSLLILISYFFLSRLTYKNIFFTKNYPKFRWTYLMTNRLQYLNYSPEQFIFKYQNSILTKTYRSSFDVELFLIIGSFSLIGYLME